MTVWNAEGRDVAFAGAPSRQVIFWQAPNRTNANGPTVGRIGSAEDDTQGSLIPPTWIPAFARYGHPMAVTGAATNRLLLNVGVIPQSWLDPREPARPHILRVCDVVAATWSGTVTRARCVFLMGSMSASGANYPNSIGFHNNGGATWFTYLSAHNRTVLRNVDTGVLTNSPHELMFELDGSTREARWYVDGVLVDSFTMGQDNTTPIVHNGYFNELFHEVGGAASGVQTNTIYAGMGTGLMIELEEVS